ncbi:MAG: restriction endonuclease subunit S [Actinobacteria bacterium]|nr:restriction endonuclease subunit S [Actinomycetota bacterium]
MTDGDRGVPVVRLGEVAKIVSGGTPSRANPAYWGGDIPWVKTANIRNGRIGIDDIDERITEDGLKRSSARIVPAGTILMAMYGQGGTRGRVSVLGVDAAINQACAAICVVDGIDPDYVFQALRHQYDAIRRMSNTGSQENLSTDLLRQIALPLPELRKQRKVAQVLMTWDDAVQSAEALAGHLQSRRDAVLRRLLDDQDANWREVALAEAGTISGSGVDKHLVPGQAPVVLANFLDVMRKDFISAADLTHLVTAPETSASKCALHRGDILLTPSSETREDIAHSAVVVEDIPRGVYSYHIVRLRLHEDWDLQFRAYALKSRRFLHQAYRLCEGSGQRYVLNLSTLREMTVRVPNSHAQRRIGHILKMADDEVESTLEVARLYARQRRALAARLLMIDGRSA